MKKFFAFLLVSTVVIYSCKKDTPITYSAWSDCVNGIQTRTQTGGTATAPASDLSRACDYSSLVQGTWKMTADSVYVQELNQTFEIVQDTSVFGEIYPPCTWDDTYAFTDTTNGAMLGGRYNYTDAGTVCSPSGTSTGKWAITNNSLIWDGSTTYPAVIKYFSATKMVTNISFTSTSGTTTYHFVEKTTYTKQ